MQINVKFEPGCWAASVIATLLDPPPEVGEAGLIGIEVTLAVWAERLADTP